MKKIIITLVLTLMAINLQAQVDRSKMPKPGPSPTINLEEPNRFELPNGLKVLVVENKKLPRVSIQLSIDNPPIQEGDKAGVASFVSSLLGNGSKSISKDDFNEEVDFLGARINFGSQSAFASSLSKYFPRVLELMADAAIHPNFTQEEFEKEKAKLITGLKSQEKDVSSIAGRVQRVLAYGANHPYGEFTTEKTVNNIQLADVEKFYRDYFLPANAYLIVIGDVSFDEVQKLVTKNFTTWKKASPPSFTFSEPSNAQYTQINFIDVPNAVQSEIAVQNLVNLKMKDPDYLSALVANQILGGGGEARLFLNLREDKGYTYGSYSRLGNDKNGPSTFRATASVRNVVTDSSVVEILKEIDQIIKKPVSEEELKNTKAKYIGNFVLALENPQTIARYALNIETQGLPKDFYKTYLERINAITIDDVQKAAKKYFSSSNARVVVTGKGSDVIENLEKVSFNGKKLSVFYFDKYGKKTEKPNYDAATPEGVTAQSVLDNYFKAVGGKDKLQGVKSTFITADASFNGATLNMIVKTTSKNQTLSNVLFGGNSVNKNVFDGTTGYVMAQGQKIDYTEQQIKDAKKEAIPFPELKNTSASLEGIEPYDNGKAYKVKMNDKRTTFFDSETGLKTKDIIVQEQGGQKISTSIIYSNYKEVNGIKFPFTMSISAGPQNFDFNVSEIKINEGVTDEDFK
ncbi:pitrilysin family protein [Aquimarina sp. 2201CG5-10]|uniref:M16 family metallopeptidase n=1 Tax=Aquimarina callyspongiae TaxID=3098150 RepID=UPI002AB3D9FC|nr:pitrilysin family protein [Aquimarina sp. 2201CG5-10]MDY8135050.1 pitrilysin family protein [Aquimarina sp. 2201CG5-10]